MRILKRSPRTEMHEDMLIQRIGEFYKALAVDEGVTEDVLDIQLTQYAILSTRIDINGDKLDFEFAKPGDSADTIRDKVMAYLDTEFFDTVRGWGLAIREHDKPVNDALAPTPPIEGDTKKK